MLWEEGGAEVDPDDDNGSDSDCPEESIGAVIEAVDRGAEGVVMGKNATWVLWLWIVCGGNKRKVLTKSKQLGYV